MTSMPIANKKTVVTSGFPAFPNVMDDKPTGLNMVVYGPPGIGKTTFAASIKEAEPERGILLFDIDKGRESVADIDVFYAKPPKLLAAEAAGEDTEGISTKLTWAELRDYLDTAIALKDKSPFGTYIFDSLSSIYYELLVTVVTGGETKKVEWPHYLEAQRILVKFIRDAKSLCEFGIHTIFTGHVKEEKDDDIINVRLSLPQGVRNEILLAVNHVGYLGRAKDNKTRELHFEPPTKRHEGPKLRQTRSGKHVPTVISDPTMAKLMTALKEK